MGWTRTAHLRIEPGMIETLEDVQTDIVNRLIRGAKSRKSPMHTPVVGTADGDLRVMVLRDFDRESYTLRFHTDARSPKVAAIAADPAMAVLLYDADEKIQIRARGVGRVETDSEAAQAAWAASTNFAKRCYLAEDAPGAPSDAGVSGLPDWAEGIQPTVEQIIPARENFAIVLIELTSLDWLYLANSGHRRAQFRREIGGEWSGGWVVP